MIPNDVIALNVLSELMRAIEKLPASTDQTNAMLIAEKLRASVIVLQEAFEIAKGAHVHACETIARERSEGKVVACPDGYQNPTDEIWFDHPADLNLLEGFVDGLKVGDEYEIDVCWTGKQKFIVRTVNADGDVDEVDFVSGDVLFTTPQPAKPEGQEPVAIVENTLSGSTLHQTKRVKILNYEGVSVGDKLYTHAQPAAEIDALKAEIARLIYPFGESETNEYPRP